MQFKGMPEGWHVSFLEPDLKTALDCKFVFQDSAKVIEMAMRGGADRTSADKQAIEYAITSGRGSVWLNLTADQYAKLRKIGLGEEMIQPTTTTSAALTHIGSVDPRPRP